MPRSLVCACLTTLMLAACSEPSTITTADKAKFTAELIAERSECLVFWKKLSEPSVDLQIIDQTYHAAKAAHCLKPDV